MQIQIHTDNNIEGYEALATWASKIAKEDGVVDWSRSAVDIDRQVREAGLRRGSNRTNAICFHQQVHGAVAEDDILLAGLRAERDDELSVPVRVETS